VPERKSRILLADDHGVVVAGFAKLLAEELEVVGTVGDGEELLAAVAAERLDLVVCDISMPKLDGLEATRRLRAAHPGVKVIILSVHDDAAHVRAAFQAGASGYVVKSGDADELLSAVREVLAGRFYTSPALTRYLVDVVVGRPAGVPEGSVSVLVVDDDPDIRRTARLWIEIEDGLVVVGEAANGREAVEIAARLGPDVVLMDLRMPEMDGIEATRKIVAARPRTRVVLLTAVDVDGTILEAVRAGAAGYVAKTAQCELAAAVHRVHSGGSYLPLAITHQLVELAAAPVASETPLSEREKEIVRLVANGWGNQQIAETLHVAEATVRSHLKRIYVKLDLVNRVELTLHAVQTGLVALSPEVRQGVS